MNTLSSYNTAAKVQQYICDGLNSSTELSALGITFLSENTKDIEFQVKNALQRQGIACVAMTPTSRFLGNASNKPAWEYPDLELNIAEYTPVNRASNKTDFATALDVANYAAQRILSSDAFPKGQLLPVSITQEEQDQLVVAKLTVKTYAS